MSKKKPFEHEIDPELLAEIEAWEPQEHDGCPGSGFVPPCSGSIRAQPTSSSILSKSARYFFMSLYLLGRCTPLDESAEEKVPISEKILPRSVSRPQARNKSKSVAEDARARPPPLHFAPAGAKPN